MLKLFLILFLLFIPSSQASVSFDATDDILECGTANDVLTENGALTISAWIKPVNEGENNTGRIVTKDTAGGAGPALVLSLTKTLRFLVAGSTTLDRITSDNTITVNAWQHILVTWTGSTTASTVHMYINGTEPTYKTSTSGATLTDNAAGTIRIGNRNGTDRTFNGQIDEVAIWDAVISATDIENLAQSRKKGMPFQILPGNLKHYWALNECNDGSSCTGTFTDLVGTSHCTPSNNPTGKALEVASYV